MTTVLTTLLPKMGYVQTLPRKLVYGTKLRGGLGIQNLWHTQGLNQIRKILEQCDRNDLIESNLIQISIELLAIKIGMGYDTKSWNVSAAKKYTKTCWALEVWEYLEQNNLSLSIKI